MLGDGHQLDMRVAQVFDVGHELVGEVAVGDVAAIFG